MNRKWGKKWMAAMLSISMVIGMFPGVGNPVRVLADEPPGQAVTQADISNADNSGKDKYGFNLTTPSSFNANDGENPYGEHLLYLEMKILARAHRRYWCRYWNCARMKERLIISVDIPLQDCLHFGHPARRTGLPG